MSTNNQRYSELDWLRVILILLVYMHHVFMPFNGDEWHIMNNDSSKILDDIMVYFEQLRLQSLFFVAGAGSYLLLQKIQVLKFLNNKLHRLLIPLLIGMILIVPPQIYYENISDYENLVDAYRQLMFSFNANHLWFIEFLIVFMVLAIPLNLILNSQSGQTVVRLIEKLASTTYGLFSLVIPLLVIRMGLKFYLPSQDHNIENLSLSMFYLFFFVAGMCFIKSPSIWQSLAKNRKPSLMVFIISSILFYAYYFSPDLSEYASIEVRWQIWWLVCTLVSWSGLMTFLGYASVYCTTTPSWLRTANELIYPYYILHQTIIVIIAFYIVQWNAGIAIKSMSLLISSFFICSSICYLLIRPFNLTRYIFGLKKK